MRLEDIHIGDTLRIRQYKDMMDEYGPVGRYGRAREVIDCKFHFTPEMIRFCGREVEVLNIIEFSGAVVLRFSNGERVDSFSFSADMLEPLEELPECSMEDLLSILAI